VTEHVPKQGSPAKFPSARLLCLASIAGMPLTFGPIAVVPIMVVIGIVPAIMTIALVTVPPFVVVEGEGHTREVNSAVRVPAITIAIACRICRCWGSHKRQPASHQANDCSTCEQAL
jgi:hypothetical protein